MNLKTACRETGLSARAVRYYINEELISPSCTENYYGKKIYKFSQNDVEELKRYAQEIPYSEDLWKPNIWGNICSVLKGILGIAIVWHPIILSLYFFIDNLTMFRYPVIEWWILLIGLFFLLPSIAALAISRIKFRFKKIVFVLLFILCFVFNGFNVLTFGFCITESHTENPKNYRKIDYAYPIDENYAYEDLFPEEIPDKAEDEVYYYRYLNIFDPIYDVYAEWTLPANEYSREVDRVSNLFDAVLKNNGGRYKLDKAEKGDYSCLILYDGEEPFVETEHIYTYLIFAYNDESNTVRYFYCASRDSGVDQPYYMKVKW